jgi:general secretion pathway protein J
MRSNDAERKNMKPHPLPCRVHIRLQANVVQQACSTLPETPASLPNPSPARGRRERSESLRDFHVDRFCKGFTLIELLVAISILAIVAVLGWRGLDSIVRARITLTSNLEQTRGLQLAFAQLQSDGEHLASSTDLAGHAVLAAQPGRLTLVRTVFADNQPSRMAVVAYRISDGVLTRRESAETRDLRELDILWKNAISDLDTAQAVVLQSGVAAMTMRLWMSDNPMWRSTDVDGVAPNADQSAPNPVIPLGLEVALQLSGRASGMSKVFLLGAT